MASRSDREYYLARAAAERAMAANAATPAAAQIHEELARGFEILAKQEEGRPILHIATPAGHKDKGSPSEL